MTLIIGASAGHGLNTAGKRTPDGEREWSFNNKVILAFEEELGRYDGVVFKRYDDRTGQTDPSLTTRTNAARKDKVDIYIDFHQNGLTGIWGNWTGVETYVYTTPTPNSLKLANIVHPELVKAYGLRDRGIKRKDLHIVREMQRNNPQMAVVLVEGGFMDSTIDIVKLRDDQVLKNAGANIAKAIAEAYKLPLKVEQQPVAPQPIDNGTLVLPANISSWAVYKHSTGTFDKTIVGYLNPKLYGGLSYKVINSPFPNYFAIRTEKFGIVNIFADGKRGESWIQPPKKAEAPQPQHTPQPSKKYLKLPATATSWNIYPLNKAPIKANAIGTLNPKKHGGLTYEILGNPQKDVYTIKTTNFGTVNIYAAKSTGAIIG